MSCAAGHANAGTEVIVFRGHALTLRRACTDCHSTFDEFKDMARTMNIIFNDTICSLIFYLAALHLPASSSYIRLTSSIAKTLYARLPTIC